MDFLLAHLERSARLFYPETGDHAADIERRSAYAARFQAGQDDPATETLILPYDRSLILTAIERVLLDDRFELGAGADYERGSVTACFRQSYDGRSGWLGRIRRSSEILNLQFEVHIEVEEDGTTEIFTSHQLPTWLEDFKLRVGRILGSTPLSVLHQWQLARGSNLLHNPILEPGQPLIGPYTGSLMDYSGCAQSPAQGEALRDLTSGDLPLGRWAFGFAAEGSVRYGGDLYLSTDHTGASMLHKGVLVCAPQNSGKTRLILRWARAANQTGYGMFLVDVKGNLYDELAPQLQGDVFVFSTDPENETCDGLDLLGGIDFRAPAGSRRIRQIVDALLPRAGWEEGEQAYFYQNHVNWLNGLLNILFLYSHHYPEHFRETPPDLSHIYDLAADEELLNKVIADISARESQAPSHKRVSPGLEFWLKEIALLIHPSKGGQRTAEYSYRTLTQSIVNAVRPFSRNGTLFSKTSRRSPLAKGRRFFSLDVLRAPPAPVSVILVAREQDVDDAETILAVTIRRLEQILYDRMDAKLFRQDLRSLVLLLDETRRIRSFEPDRYITFARQARAGCVVVYQSLDQIGDDRKINIILENVGTQIYLGSLTGKTAQLFTGMLPKRSRPQFSITSGLTGGTLSGAVQTGQETVDYFTTAELFRLPGGRYPALVYINDLIRRPPFLVDMDEGLAEASIEERL
jgi:hypothetical protein